MSVCLLVTSVQLDPPLYVVRAGRTVTLGRSPTADVQLPDPTVSPEHAVLRRRGKQYLVTDLGSTNGTALLSSRGADVPVWLDQDSPRVVQDGDRLLLGKVELTLRLDAPAGLPSEDLARDLVALGLTSIGRQATTELVERALEDLVLEADERIARVEPAPPERSGPDEPLDHPGEVDATDLALGAVAALVLAGALGALYWLLERAGSL